LTATEIASPQARKRKGTKMRMKVWALACTTALFAASGAHAGQIDITNVGVQSYETTSLTGTIDSSPLSESPITTLIELTTTTGSILPVFCVDLLHNIDIGSYSPPLPYITSPVSTDSTGAQPGTGNPLTSPVPGEIQALANLGAADYYAGVTNADVYTAIAASIWYLEYNTNGNSLSVTGDTAVGSALAGDPSGATGLIAADLAYAAANATDYSIGLYPGTIGQGFTGTGQGFTLGVPEPSTWAMMLIGFAGLGFAGYRRGKAKAA
jgi:PEP-CTERM motif